MSHKPSLKDGAVKGFGSSHGLGLSPKRTRACHPPASTCHIAPLPALRFKELFVKTISHFKLTAYCLNKIAHTLPSPPALKTHC